MRMQPVISRLSRVGVAAGLALSFSHSGLAQGSGAGGTVSVTVFADRYVSAGQVFADLDALEAWVKTLRPQSVRLDVCEPASSRQLRAAGYRFRHVYLEMRLVVAAQSVCAVDAAVRAGVSAGARQAPGAHEDEAAERYWQQLMP